MGRTRHTTVDPCAMRAGAQCRSHIGHLVLGRRLLELTGNHAESPTPDLPCREVVARGQEALRVIGPVPELVPGAADGSIVVRDLERWQPRAPLAHPALAHRLQRRRTGAQEFARLAWDTKLNLDYRRDGIRTVAFDRHEGPLRVLKALYPEGPGVCNHVLVHPPGGIVGGDQLQLDIEVGAGAHALITTPGATRFYRSGGAPAVQRIQATLADDARLEWLPLETLAYDGCLAENRLRVDLAAGAEMMGRELLVLGLPASDAPFRSGSVLQALELPGAWIERGRIDADDRRLLDSPLGLAGACVLGTLWFGTGKALAPSRREALLDAARAAVEADAALSARAGVTSPDERVVVVRLLADQAEPAMRLLGRIWAAWREQAWGMVAMPPRIWRT